MQGLVIVFSKHSWKIETSFKSPRTTLCTGDPPPPLTVRRSFQTITSSVGDKRTPPSSGFETSTSQTQAPEEDLLIWSHSAGPLGPSQIRAPEEDLLIWSPSTSPLGIVRLFPTGRPFVREKLWFKLPIVELSLSHCTLEVTLTKDYVAPVTRLCESDANPPTWKYLEQTGKLFLFPSTGVCDVTSSSFLPDVLLSLHLKPSCTQSSTGVCDVTSSSFSLMSCFCSTSSPAVLSL